MAYHPTLTLLGLNANVITDEGATQLLNAMYARTIPLSLILVGNKLDLLPEKVNPGGVERWVRAEAGFPL